MSFVSCNINEVTDEELVFESRNNQEAFTALLSRYEGLIYTTCKGYFIRGSEFEDLYQEALIGFYKAICDYEEKYNVSFYHFSKFCIKRQVITAIKTANRQKHNALNYASSLNKTFDGRSETLLEIVSDQTVRNPEERYICNESIYEAFRSLEQKLTDFEFRVLSLKLHGLDHSVAARKMGVSYRGILNAMYRIRKKAKDLKSTQLL